MKILLFSRYDTLAASSRYRTYQYLPYLKKEGIEVEREHLTFVTPKSGFYVKLF
ncbi:hypothetical protein [Microcystis sp. M038S2]|uniref:hypothetical protein n=1 Tax=Microcystis sp. M038S2 TaxID=2771164 RepID=UPI0025840F57|nr:hypothetical protein [Microcystis sp. M038S2]MCA2952676.1 hypothetical protein [Microcystis sp. M112S1]